MFCLLWLFFVILNGRLTLEIAGVGILVALFAEGVAILLLNWSLAKEKLFFRCIPAAIRYALVLLWEIFKANLSVLKCIYSPKRVEPAIVSVTRKAPEEWRTVLEANSITLTPGTVTMRLADDRLVVHCLDKSMADGLEGSVFEREIKKIGGKHS